MDSDEKPAFVPPSRKIVAEVTPEAFPLAITPWTEEISSAPESKAYVPPLCIMRFGIETETKVVLSQKKSPFILTNDGRDNTVKVPLERSANDKWKLPVTSIKLLKLRVFITNKESRARVPPITARSPDKSMSVTSTLSEGWKSPKEAAMSGE